MTETRRCVACGAEKPLNNEHFQSVSFFSKGYSYYCNPCSAKSKLTKNDEPKSPDLTSLDTSDDSDQGVGAIA
jgi:hypothetical protein